MTLMVLMVPKRGLKLIHAGPFMILDYARGDFVPNSGFESTLQPNVRTRSLIYYGFQGLCHFTFCPLKPCEYGAMKRSPLSSWSC